MCEPLRGKKESGYTNKRNTTVFVYQDEKRFKESDVKSAIEGFLNDVMKANIDGQRINILEMIEKWFPDVI